MVRVKRGSVAVSRRNQIRKYSKGFKGSHSRLWKVTKEQVCKSLLYRYRGRKIRRRDLRALNICRINAFSSSLKVQKSWFSTHLINILPENLVWVNDSELLSFSLFEYFDREKINYSRIYSFIRRRIISLSVKTLAQLIFFDKKAFYELLCTRPFLF
jgi:large subunit ribosomal protein L20